MEKEKRTQSNQAGTSLGCPTICYQTLGEQRRTGDWREVPTVRQKSADKNAWVELGAQEENFFFFFFCECPLAPQCLSRMTDAGAQSRTTSGGGLRRVNMLNKHIQSTANALIPPHTYTYTPTKPHFGYNIDSSDSSVYTRCLYIGTNVPSPARRSWCFYLHANILGPCNMFCRPRGCVDNVVW